jgi:aminoglycoside phosphotransferase (APT) family kinase protein
MAAVVVSAMNAPIAQGRTAEIFPVSASKVLKLLRPGYPREEAEQEARLTRIAGAAGAPAPWVGEVVERNDRFGFEMERIDGPLLAERVLQESSQAGDQAVSRFADMMARAHYAVHRPFGGTGLRSQHERLADKVRRAPGLSRELQRRVLDCLDGLPDGQRICHGDFHPLNLVLTDDGIRVIDWVDGTVGHPAADVARSDLLLRLSGVTGTDLPLEERRRLDLFREMYVNAYCRLAACSVRSITAWLPVVSAARLCEDVPGESDWLLRTVAECMRA